MSKTRILRSFLIAGFLTLLAVFFLRDKDIKPVQSTNNQNNSILIEEISKMREENGAVFAWKYFKDNYSLDLRGSHDVAHYIGTLIYKDTDINGVSNCDQSFSFGCYHGFVEEFVRERGVDDLKELVKVCEKIPEFESEITCYHGMGHGILEYYSYKLDPSLQKCDQLLSSQFAPYCYNGVFMENGLETIGIASKEAPIWPCNKVEDKYRERCYSNISTLLFAKFEQDPEKLNQACLMAEEKYRDDCFFSLGLELSQIFLKEPLGGLDFCQEMEGDISENCGRALATGIVFQRQPFESAEAICQSIDPNYRQSCMQEISEEREKYNN